MPTEAAVPRAKINKAAVKKTRLLLNTEIAMEKGETETMPVL